MVNDVSVSIAFDDPADKAMIMTIAGGIRIEVDGVELTRLVNQAEYNRKVNEEEPDETWWYDYTGEALDAGNIDYKGTVMLFITLSFFAENVLELARGSAERFDQLVSEVGDSPHRLVVSYLDGQHGLVRVAYQSYGFSVGKNLRPVVQSSVGYAVSLPQLCGEVARCLNEFKGYADAHAPDADSNSWYRERVAIADELEQYAAEKSSR
ncbi:hypothetical protein GJR96_02570 [Haloferax sp. MBLA0076]|uniref:Uncharacterized protein n=1 Tax=Haloferax litoreum TaxID=2666140 RepID=A0A6A8GCI8_9EURY|nr:MULTISPECIES: hypothetical protein [Haloferax]KAB1192383.1 hypothetical protein Hfx1148_02555 [Haloferax sp. CBA1148]MRX20848.1 hypothetical protein [Haloferax litoreum]